MSLLLDAALRHELIEGLLAKLRDYYVFPEKAAEMAGVIRERQGRGDYDDIKDGTVFRDRLTEHLRGVCDDKHLRLVYYPDPQPPRDNLYTDPEALAAYWADAVLDNYGYSKAERLKGNVGYLLINALDEAEVTAPTITAAFQFVAHTADLIIDLRQNSGGAPTGVAFVCSYLFPPEPVHLNDIYCRDGNRTQQFWTLPFVPGLRYLDKPVYLLTSGRTFSAGEELAYNLQVLRRATVVGEVTIGGANPVDFFQLHPHLAVRVPSCRAVNPRTGTNWEGVGVQPDILVNQERALEVAYRVALESVAETYRALASPPSNDRLQELQDALSELSQKG